MGMSWTKMKDKPNKITAALKVVATGDFYDDEASEETLRYCVEQDLEDAGFDVDVEPLKEREPMKPTWSQGKAYCGNCGQRLPRKSADREINYCSYCGRAVKWK